MKVSDIHWLAGFAEGDGCFTLHGKSASPRFDMSGTDLDVITRAANIIGHPVYGPYASSGFGKKPVYRAMVHGAKAAGW